MLFSSRSGQRSIAPVTNARDNTPAAPGPLTAPVSTTRQHSAFRRNQPLSLCQPTSISAREECGEADSAKVTTALFQASPGARGMKVGWWGLWSRWKSGEIPQYVLYLHSWLTPHCAPPPALCQTDLEECAGSVWLEHLLGMRDGRMKLTTRGMC